MPKLKTCPMRIHKNLIIDALRRWPEDVEKFLPAYTSARLAIAHLEAHPSEWITADEHGNYALR